MDNKETCSQVEAWLKTWTIDPFNAKKAFETFYTGFKKQKMLLEFKERPGISYSLRAKHADQKDRPLFVLIDVVDDDDEERWLSVCFYADMVQDPEGLGDFVPQGLMGQDALCINLEEDDETRLDYIKKRIKQASTAAKKF